tara:strand:- start:21197 stop:23395 length:2199 start_codon:yes stop_codon:yes gene_type:complete
MASSQYSRRRALKFGLVLIIILIFYLFVRGTDVKNSALEGAPRDPKLIYNSDSKFYKSKDHLFHQAEQDLDEYQILFGDLHVHTTYSLDAFTLELPMMGLQGIHDSAMACDFARYCANLDFFSFNDHAESLTPEHWQEQKKIIQQCNISNDDPVVNDLTVFPGWEWTQIGNTKDNHWGHRNVIFKDIENLPSRPIGSRTPESGLGVFNTTRDAVQARWIDPLNFKRYSDLEWLLNRVEDVPYCDSSTPVQDLPLDCYEYAKTPGDLFSKLDEWGFDSIVIPHGTTWGFHVPYNASWDNRLNSDGHDPEKQILLEVMSGHGNSEEFRSFIASGINPDGSTFCPEPTDDFLPCCWQAGEIMKKRCDGLSDEECEARVELAKQYALLAGPYSNMVFPESEPEEWLNCNQCLDCFKPSFNYRPKQSAQYAMALTNFDNDEPSRYEFGFIASTDDHTARPGTGYKQYERRKMTFASGFRSSWFDFTYKAEDPNFPEIPETLAGRSVSDFERNSSFVYPGGIVAVHSKGRSQDDIWEALKNKRVYGTSGPRILLWFELLNSPSGRSLMGEKVIMSQNPSFLVKTAGSFKQKPGCPDTSIDSLSARRLDYLCSGECYNPDDERYLIDKIEIIKITPQTYQGEEISTLIQDPWKSFDCKQDSNGCVITFQDEEYERDSNYYVRVIQEQTDAINGRQIFVDQSSNSEVSMCHGNYKTDLDSDCLWPTQERAWSSPIYLIKP